jgi:hypothetical protein
VEAMMKNMNAASRWARDTYRGFERGEISGARCTALFAALTAEAREDLLTQVQVGFDELEDAYRGEREYMPPCEFRRLRWLALFIDSPLDDQIGEHLMFTTDSAWTCGCRSCTALADRIDAGTRRFVAAMREAEERGE